MGNVVAFPEEKLRQQRHATAASKLAAVWGTNTSPLPLGRSRVPKRMNTPNLILILLQTTRHFYAGIFSKYCTNKHSFPCRAFNIYIPDLLLLLLLNLASEELNTARVQHPLTTEAARGACYPRWGSDLQPSDPELIVLTAGPWAVINELRHDGSRDRIRGWGVKNKFKSVWIFLVAYISEPRFQSCLMMMVMVALI